MEPLTLESLRSEVRRLARLIDAPSGSLPTFGRTQDGARPHLEVDERGYHWVVVERGREFERVTSQDVDETLYRTFQSATFDMACEYELAHRNPKEDFRRILFRRQLELLTTLSPEWAERRRLELEATLERNPFVDRGGA